MLNHFQVWQTIRITTSSTEHSYEPSNANHDRVNCQDSLQEHNHSQ